MTLSDEDELPVSIGSLTKDPNSPRVGPTRGRLVRLEGINDGSEEIVDVKISRFEAEILMRHWFDRYWTNAYYCRERSQTGPRGWRISAYTRYRMNNFEDVIGEKCIESLEAEGASARSRLTRIGPRSRARTASSDEDSE